MLLNLIFQLLIDIHFSTQQVAKEYWAVANQRVTCCFDFEEAKKLAY
jgi:hypothetical protein